MTASVRYNTVAMLLHWLIAALILTNISVAWYFDELKGLAKIPPLQLHKSIGITVLILSVLRLAWRLINPPPKMPDTVKGWERFLAVAVHVLFYVVMIGLPLSGWFMVSASRLIHTYPITLFGLFEWPAIGPLTTLPPAQMRETRETLEEIHELLGKLAYALIVLHVGAALTHQFIRRDAINARMIPFLKAPAS